MQNRAPVGASLLDDLLGRSGVPHLVRQRDAGRARGRNTGQPVDRDRRTRFEDEGDSDRGYGVKHRAGRARQRAPVIQCLRIASIAATPDKAHAVRLEAHGSCRSTTDKRQVKEPWRRVCRRARPPRREDRLQLWIEFSLDEELVERWMCGVGRRRTQHDFGVARRAEQSAPIRKIRNEHAAQLHRIVGRNRELAADLKALIPPPDDGASVAEVMSACLVRQQAARPCDHPTARRRIVAYMAARTAAIECCVLAPARDRQALPAARAMA